MIRQYPHTLKFSAGTGPVKPIQDTSGNWIEPDTSGLSEVSLVCRLEPNDKGRTVKSEDGQELVYGFEVYAKRNTPRLEPGTPVRVLDGEVEIGAGTVKRYHKGQLNSMIWV